MQNAGRRMIVFSTKINIHRLVWCYQTHPDIVFLTAYSLSVRTRPTEIATAVCQIVTLAGGNPFREGSGIRISGMALQPFVRCPPLAAM